MGSTAETTFHGFNYVSDNGKLKHLLSVGMIS